MLGPSIVKRTGSSKATEIDFEISQPIDLHEHRRTFEGSATEGFDKAVDGCMQLARQNLARSIVLLGA